jgi:uncharacterized membrane protein YedE/YeeE
MDDPQVIARTIVWSGFGLGAALGFLANKTNFCTMGAISDVVNMGDWGRMRAWLLAIGVAILGTNFLAYSGAIDLTRTIYAGVNFPWLAYIVGGLTFGVGMTLASGCGNKTLVRIGGGNLKSLVVFMFMGFAAYLTLKGLFAVFRVGVLQAQAVTTQLPSAQTIPHLLAQSAGGDLATMQLAAALCIGGALVAFALLNKSFWASRDNLVAGILVGAIIVIGWYVTGKLGFAENPDTLEEMTFGTNSKLAESMSFIAPAAYTLELLAFWTDTSTVATWGIATVLGVAVGSFAYALVSKSFRWEHFVSTSDMLRHIIGAVLMGFGGVTAMGCTVGQGITGFSTLSLGSVLVFVSIVAGATATMKYEYIRMMREA